MPGGTFRTAYEVGKAVKKHVEKTIERGRKAQTADRREPAKQGEWKVPDTAVARKLRERNINQAEQIEKETGFKARK